MPSHPLGRLRSTAALVLLGAAVACGGSAAPGPTAPGPAADASVTSGGDAGPAPSGNPATEGDTDDRGGGGDAVQTGDTEAPLADGGQDPGDLILGLAVGTEPAFEGALVSADRFPLSEIVAVLSRDAIPALTDPPMASPDQVSYLSADDLVLGVAIGGDARAYPHNIGWWHEIVNDVVGGQPICVTFCPLTGTGLVFDGRAGDGTRRTLGVSGMLYNTNLVMYDRLDGNTLYPQIYAAGVRGQGIGRVLRLLPVVETTWRTWKRLHPQTRVVARGPYGNSQYRLYPYGNYRTDDTDFLFPVRPPVSANPNDQARRFPSKAMILGVRVEGEPKAYPFSSLGDRRVVNDVVGGLDLVVLHDRAAALTVSYARRVGDRVLTFEVSAGDEAFPFAMRDLETGTLWDALGRGLTGELAGERLTPVPAHTSMWFAWVTFWPATEVWDP